jgi:putative transposase
MTNHVHLLVTPQAARALSRMMQRLGQRYVQQLNGRHRRTGTLWEGRYKATVVDSDEYVLRCYRYIELNPVRAGMQQSPATYRWSSYRHNALGEVQDGVIPHETYRSLGQSPQARQRAYRVLVDDGLSQIELREIRHATQRAWPLGSDRFDAQIAAMINRKIVRNSWGGDRRSAEKQGQGI